MTRVKSLKPTGVPKSDDAPPSGYQHRVHRSKKGRAKDLQAKKLSKYIKSLKFQRSERRARIQERKYL